MQIAYGIRIALKYISLLFTCIINMSGVPVTIDDVQRIVEQLRPQFPGRNLNLKLIRDSVIASMLNERGLPLEQVQIFAGHRWISSTARYQPQNMAEQRELLNKWFPL